MPYYEISSLYQTGLVDMYKAAMQLSLKNMMRPSSPRLFRRRKPASPARIQGFEVNVLPVLVLYLQLRGPAESLARDWLREAVERYSRPVYPETQQTIVSRVLERVDAARALHSAKGRYFRKSTFHRWRRRK